jgi:hypothetical protein
LESRKRLLNDDLIELSLVKFGIFSVDIWKASLTSIVINRINDFEYADMDDAEIRDRITQFLTMSVNELEESFFNVNKGTIGGFFRGGVASITGVFGNMKEDIPLLTESIITFFKDVDNKEMIKDFVIHKLNDYADSTFSSDHVSVCFTYYK